MYKKRAVPSCFTSTITCHKRSSGEAEKISTGTAVWKNHPARNFEEKNEKKALFLHINP